MKIKSRTARGLGLAALTIAGAASTASAAFTSFDSDGPGGNAYTVIAGLDWGVGNALADNSLPIQVGKTFQLYYQAALAGVINTSGLTIAPSGLNSRFEITAVMSATMRVNSTGGNSFEYALAPVQSANSFFEIWYDATPDVNYLAGTGFNDGARILLGAPNPALTSNGTLGGTAQAGEPLDQFGINNYPGVLSFQAAGGMADENIVTSADPSFFLVPLASMSFNTSTVGLFKQVDPSALFAGVAGGVLPAVVPSLGAVNGINGPDYQLQADGNSSFTEVPEPGTMLFAVGLGLASVVRRRRH